MMLCPCYTLTSFTQSPWLHHLPSDSPGDLRERVTLRVSFLLGRSTHFPVAHWRTARPWSRQQRPGALAPQGLAGSCDCPSVWVPWSPRQAGGVSLQLWFACPSHGRSRGQKRGRMACPEAEDVISEDPRRGDCGRFHHFRLGGCGERNEGVPGSRAEPPSSPP